MGGSEVRKARKSPDKKVTAALAAVGLRIRHARARRRHEQQTDEQRTVQFIMRHDKCSQRSAVTTSMIFSVKNNESERVERATTPRDGRS